jgi:hypothetical protein
LWQITREVLEGRQLNPDEKKPAHPRRLVQEMSTKPYKEFSPINTSGILIVAAGIPLRQQENASE